MNSYTLAQLKVGDSASLVRVFTEEDVKLFAQVTGDTNPAHLDADYAKGTMFKERIVHGMLTASLFSSLLGTRLPGLGTIYVGQTLKFLRPVYFHEEITATVTVKELLPERNRVIIDCQAVNAQGETVLVGEATMMPPRDSLRL